MTNPCEFLSRFPMDHRLSREQALSLVQLTDQTALIAAAGRVATRLMATRSPIRARSSFRSPNCAATSATTARSPVRPATASAYLTPEQVLAIARAGAAAGCKEACSRSATSRNCDTARARGIAEHGHEPRSRYLARNGRPRPEGNRPAAAPQSRTDDADDLAASTRCLGLARDDAGELSPGSGAGGPHHGSPERIPQARLDTLAVPASARVPSRPAC